MNTVLCLPPTIKQYLDKNLLMTFLDRSYQNLHINLIPKSLKKIRCQDVGRKKEFEKLYQEYMELYERKKIEEAEYETKIKEAKQKRSCISNAGNSCVFKRMDT